MADASPLTVIPYHQHETNDYPRRPALVAGNVRQAWQVARQRSNGKVIGYVLSGHRNGHGFAVKGWFKSSGAAQEAVPEFLKALGLTTILWLSTFAVLATVFP